MDFDLASVLPAFLINTPWVDTLTVVIIVISALLGLFRGFIREILDLASWVAAFVVTLLFVEPATVLLTPHIDAPAARTFIAGGGLFLVTLIAGGLVSFIISYFVRRTGISVTDSLLGMLFGIARGSTLMVALVLVAGLTPLTQTEQWKTAQTTPYLELLAKQLVALMPSDVAQQFFVPATDAPAPSMTDEAINEQGRLEEDLLEDAPSEEDEDPFAAPLTEEG